MLICLAVTRMSSSIALLFFLSPTLCLFQSPLLLCPLLASALLPALGGLHANKYCLNHGGNKYIKSHSNYLDHSRKMESFSSHFNQSVCVRVSLCQRVGMCAQYLQRPLGGAGAWLRERGKMDSWMERKGELTVFKVFDSVFHAGLTAHRSINYISGPVSITW